MSNLLGCGTYRVILHARDDLSRPLAVLDFTSLEWGRVVDDTSEARVTVGAEGCCDEPVRSLRPWATTMALYRSADGGPRTRVFSGPLVSVKPGPGGQVFTARDCSAWLDRRLVHTDQIHAAADLADIFQALFDDAMDPDPVPDFTLTISPTGVDGDREILAEQHAMAGDEMRELANTGLDWTVVDRVMLAGGDEVPTPPIATLIDQHFAVLPEVELDGLQQANHWIVQGSGGGAEGDEVFGESTATPGPEGLLEQVASEPTILDSPSADVAAQTRAAASAQTPLLVSGGQLLADAPLPIELAVPGARVRMALQETCIPVLDIRRLVSLKVSADAEGGEQVSVEWSPLGTAAGDPNTLAIAAASSYLAPHGVDLSHEGEDPPPEGLVYGFSPSAGEETGIAVGADLGFTMMRSHDKDYNQSTASMEARIHQAAAAGIETVIQIGFDSIPPGTGTIGAMAARFGPGGTFWNTGQPGAGLGALASRFIELGNENSYSYSPKPGPSAGTAYAVFCRAVIAAVNAANPAVGCLMQIDDANISDEWTDRIFAEYPESIDEAAGWVLHPYGRPVDATPRLDAALAALAGAGLADPVLFVTEDGLSTDDGATVYQGASPNNYNHPTNLTYAAAGPEWQTKLDFYVASYPQVRFLFRYQAFDQHVHGYTEGGHAQREHFFGMVQNDGVSTKGALTTVEAAFAAAHPRA